MPLRRPAVATDMNHRPASAQVQDHRPRRRRGRRPRLHGGEEEVSGGRARQGRLGVVLQDDPRLLRAGRRPQAHGGARPHVDGHDRGDLLDVGKTASSRCRVASTPSTWPHERLGKRPLPPRVNALDYALTRDERRRRGNARPQRERRDDWPMIGRPRVHRVVGRQRELRRLFT